MSAATYASSVHRSNQVRALDLASVRCWYVPTQTKTVEIEVGLVPKLWVMLKAATPQPQENWPPGIPQ
eukprot:scaffold68498_cov35-Cyclotella_meneghiniana.AAC.4